MSEEHPNISLLKQLDLRDLASAGHLFAENVVWHYFNPTLPELQGDYVGLNGIHSFFRAIGGKTRETFKVEPVSITAVGDELVVVLTHSYSRDGLPWDVGLHYCNTFGHDQPEGRILDWLGGGAIECRSIGTVYDNLHFPDGFEIRGPTRKFVW